MGERTVAGSRTTPLPRRVVRARAAVYLVFFINGTLLASLLARLPSVRDDLDLTPQSLGLVLLSGSVGSLIALPLAGFLVARVGVSRVIVVAATVGAVGVACAGLAPSVPVLVVTLFFWGFGNGCWDVAMNVEAADVEQRVGTTLMPRFHGAFSIGTVVGAGVAAGTAFGSIGRGPHLVVMAVLVLVGAQVAARGFLPARPQPVDDGTAAAKALRFGVRDAWREPRTLLVGITVLGFALVEGIAGDWLAIAVVDSRGAENWVGSAVYGVFLTAMTVGRFTGPVLLDRVGRYRPLLGTALLGAIGAVVVVFVPGIGGAVTGAVLWGLGASLGFPVGMSAGADDSARAAARVSVVASIAYTAFLAGPPLVGLLGERFGTDTALLTVVVAALLAAAASSAVRPLPAAAGPGDEASAEAGRSERGRVGAA